MKRTKLGTRLVVKRKIQSLEKLRVVGVSGGRNLEKEAFFSSRRRKRERERLRFAIVLEKLSLLFRELKKFQHRESVVRKKKKEKNGRERE